MAVTVQHLDTELRNGRIALEQLGVCPPLDTQAIERWKAIEPLGRKLAHTEVMATLGVLLELDRLPSAQALHDAEHLAAAISEKDERLAQLELQLNHLQVIQAELHDIRIEHKELSTSLGHSHSAKVYERWQRFVDGMKAGQWLALLLAMLVTGYTTMSSCKATLCCIPKGECERTKKAMAMRELSSKATAQTIAKAKLTARRSPPHLLEARCPQKATNRERNHEHEKKTFNYLC